MKSNYFQYPDKIENEWEVLKIYKEKFPEIIKEYESFVKKTYCNPLEYQKIVQFKVEEFDKNMSIFIEQFENGKQALIDLIKLSFDFHYNYAMNFWLISYAFNEGPIVQHYLGLIEKLLKKVYLNETELITAKENFIRTDYTTFYHKILADSLELAELLSKIPEIQEDLQKAKELNPKLRYESYNKMILILQNLNTEESKKILNRWRRHLGKNNLTPIYNLLNQAIDNYEKNMLLDRELKEVGLKVNETLNLAKKKLTEKDYIKLANLYLLIKEMLKAKDETFGRRDPELFVFWNKLTNKIIALAEEEFKIKIDKERSNLTIPWILENKLPNHQKDMLKKLENKSF